MQYLKVQIHATIFPPSQSLLHFFQADVPLVRAGSPRLHRDALRPPRGKARRRQGHAAYNVHNKMEFLALHMYDVRKTLELSGFVPLATVMITQPTSTIICFWAIPPLCGCHT